MNNDATEEFAVNAVKLKIFEQKEIVGWYCLSSKSRINCTAFATYNKPNFIKRFFMRTLLDFHWIKDEKL